MFIKDIKGNQNRDRRQTSDTKALTDVFHTLSFRQPPMRNHPFFRGSCRNFSTLVNQNETIVVTTVVAAWKDIRSLYR